MPINIEKILKKALQRAFAKTLEQAIQSKAEAFFTRAFADGSPLSRKLEEKIEKGFERFLDGRRRGRA
jgi:hypothetical protein